MVSSKITQEVFEEPNQKNISIAYNNRYRNVAFDSKHTTSVAVCFTYFKEIK